MKGLIGLIIFVAGVWAIYRIWMTEAPTETKVLWTALVALLPVIGLAVWLFKGPGSPYATGGPA